MTLLKTWISAFSFLALLAVPANAKEGQKEEMKDLLIPAGMSFAVGGGVSGFTGENARELADVGGVWEARFAFGTRETIGIEAAYLGGARGMDALGLDKDAILLGTGLETNVRIRLVDAMVYPYLLAGVGWRHYELTRADTNTSSVTDSDDVFEVPVGIGAALRLDPIIIDARAVFRSAFDSDLVQATANTSDTELHNWTARLNVGWEF